MFYVIYRLGLYLQCRGRRTRSERTLSNDASMPWCAATVSNDVINRSEGEQQCLVPQESAVAAMDRNPEMFRNHIQRIENSLKDESNATAKGTHGYTVEQSEMLTDTLKLFACFVGYDLRHECIR
jgi:hypothetical protein